jgi:glycosyltransferase involved in cell wall biosynthesis
MNSLGVVICSYNRPKLVQSLVNQLKEFESELSEIIVVDSSDQSNLTLSNDSQVVYLKSHRKSQPYQRFVGAKNSKSTVVVFFDDDVKIINKKIFADILQAFGNDEIVGVSGGIHYENGIELNKSKNIRALTYTGKISWLGKTTGLPQVNAFVEYFPGPFMAFRKSIIAKLFDDYLFFIFENRIAMGEDKVISMRASIYGKLFFLGSSKYLYHPPEASTYFNNEIDFLAKTVFSRLWLSKVYAKVHDRNKALPYFYFAFYFIKYYLKYLLSLDVSRMKGLNKSLTYLLKF